MALLLGRASLGLSVPLALLAARLTRDGDARSLPVATAAAFVVAVATPRIRRALIAAPDALRSWISNVWFGDDDESGADGGAECMPALVELHPQCTNGATSETRTAGARTQKGAADETSKTAMTAVWQDDADPRFARKRAQDAAFVWCRHDLDICAHYTPLDAQRAWDAQIGVVPLSALERWREEDQQRSAARPPAAGAIPSPRRPFSTTAAAAAQLPEEETATDAPPKPPAPAAADEQS
ncbi:hypothetical protein M885DRAFT_509771 [Pelagophyceae sp. CCMP2097]|nr:hypothetical protein M885DRAFT_509771 [Pelagophyceae sp. CCMP2097]